jgi:alpha-D-ribose 1-methylphosphonate 5-phosphate C-P lyase
VSDMQDFQDAGERARRELGVDGTAGDAQDVNHPFTPQAPDDSCLVCGLAKSYRRHG